jgi:hypothetical protein
MEQKTKINAEEGNPSGARLQRVPTYRKTQNKAFATRLINQITIAVQH